MAATPVKRRHVTVMRLKICLDKSTRCTDGTIAVHRGTLITNCLDSVWRLTVIVTVDRQSQSLSARILSKHVVPSAAVIFYRHAGPSNYVNLNDYPRIGNTQTRLDMRPPDDPSPSFSSVDVIPQSFRSQVVSLPTSATRSRTVSTNSHGWKPSNRFQARSTRRPPMSDR